MDEKPKVENSPVDRLSAPLRLMARAKEFRTEADAASELSLVKGTPDGHLLLAASIYRVGAELCVGLSRALVILERLELDDCEHVSGPLDPR